MESTGAAPALAREAEEVAQGLNLTLRLKEPAKMMELLGHIAALQPKTKAALKELHFVHYARFLPSHDNTELLVITVFDGNLQHYILDFAAAISDVFSAILEYIEGAPPLPVKEYPREFWAFVRKNNRMNDFLGAAEPWPLYCAYPQKTVLDITGPRQDLPPAFTEPAAAAIDFGDVQGNVLRGYRTHFARHFALQITHAEQAHAFIAGLVGGEAASPQITTAREWGTQRPEYFLNIGFTAAGLRALGVPQDTMAAFPAAFLDGPAHAERAASNGDFGASAPEHWSLGRPDQPVHLLLSLYADEGREQAFEDRSNALRGLWAGGGLTELSAHDATALPHGKVHFGYTEDLSQPRIAGVPDATQGPDRQPQAAAGEFLLGKDYVDAYGGTSIDWLPEALAHNGTYAAVRILAQDVDAFERLLAVAGAKHDLDPEEIAAKLMGRWRNGDPLTLVPTQPAHAPAPLTPQQQNDFDFAPTPAHPASVHDFDGAVCPVGSHIRRMNPRGAQAAGKPYSRRIFRRGMPYGRAAKPGEPQGERGLFGMFICGDLERQFEFMMEIWANGDLSASGIRNTQDPIIGCQSLGGGFVIPRPGASPVTLEVPRLVHTRGSVYTFMPGIGGLRFLAGLAPAAGQGLGGPSGNASVAAPATPSPSQPIASGFDPDRFNPKDPAFLADPYPFFALFRKHKPVHRVRFMDRYDSYWVFSHALVTQVCEAKTLFLKEKRQEPQGNRGLFKMDPPRHTQVRAMLDPLFAKAIASASGIAAQMADAALADATKAGVGRVELVSAYAKRVPRNVFMSVLGVPKADWERVGQWVDTLLACYDRTLAPEERRKAEGPEKSLGAYLFGLRGACPAQASGSALMCLMNKHAEPQGMSLMEVLKSAGHFALGGYLSTEFLIATGVHNLLRDGGQAMQLLRREPWLLGGAIEEMKRFDAPFQMADRYAAQDTELGGLEIAAGSMVTVVYGSANRDDAVAAFAEPDRFDITRTPSPANYVFGHGIHHCIGDTLVAAVAPIVFGKLLQALPGLALAEQAPVRLQDPYFRSFKELVLSFQ